MRTLRANQFESDMLLITDRYVVHRITAVELVPDEKVTLTLVNQVSGRETKRDLPRLSLHAVEEPYTVKIGSGEVSVGLAMLSNSEGRPVFRHTITDQSAGISYEDTDLRLAAGVPPSNEKAMAGLLSFLPAAGESYRYGVGGGVGDNADLLPRAVAEWCYQHDDEITLAALEIEQSLGREL